MLPVCCPLRERLSAAIVHFTRVHWVTRFAQHMRLSTTGGAANKRLQQHRIRVPPQPQATQLPRHRYTTAVPRRAVQ
jgi:hypothetical protein